MSFSKKSCVYMSYKKKLCVYMSFNIKQHIYTSLISSWFKQHSRNGPWTQNFVYYYHHTGADHHWEQLFVYLFFCCDAVTRVRIQTLQVIKGGTGWGWDVRDLRSWVRLPWLAHDKAPEPYITIPQYWFNKTKQHTHTQVALRHIAV